MATVQIANIYNPVTFGRRIQEAQTAYNRFINSGIAVPDPIIQAQLNQGGNTGELTSFNALAQAEPNYSTDNPASSSTPKNIGSKLQRFRTAARNESWSTMDLARELALIDPVGAITDRIGQFWASDDEQRLIQTLLGLLADNVANDAGDMVVDVATDGAGAVGDAERIGSDRVLDGLQTMGDAKNALTAMAIHSQIHTRLQKQNLISFVPASEGNAGFETYLGKRVIIDDSLPAVAGTNRITYTCIMFGAGVVGVGNGRVLTPSELQREAAAGDGGGQDILHSRVSNVMHPDGFDFLSATLNGAGGITANRSDLALAANWDRKNARKNIPLAYIQVND